MAITSGSGVDCRSAVSGSAALELHWRKAELGWRRPVGVRGEALASVDRLGVAGSDESEESITGGSCNQRQGWWKVFAIHFAWGAPKGKDETPLDVDNLDVMGNH